MSFEDREIVCIDCSQGFVFSSGEQEFYERKGFREEPKRCKPCRDARKLRRNDGSGGRAPRSGPRGADAFESSGRFGEDNRGSGSTGNGFGFHDTGHAGGRAESGNEAGMDDEDNIGNRLPPNGSSPAHAGLRSGRGGDSARAHNHPSQGRARDGANTRGGAGRGPRAADRGPRRELHDATCANCGTTTQVPFRPMPGRPVYCRECFASRSASAGGR